jgi:hypothetical protein
MAEYTPTTRDVKRKYMLVVPGSGEAERAFHYGPTNKGTEFDRWLAEHDREVYQRAIEECKRSYHAGTEPFFNA